MAFTADADNQAAPSEDIRMFAHRSARAVLLALAMSLIAACGEESSQPPEPTPPAAAVATPAPADTEADTVILQAEQPFVAMVTMAPREAGSAHEAFPANYRPTLLFDAAPTEVVCVLDMSQPVSAFSPGDSHRISGRCREDVTLPRDKLGFLVQEGGRDVGRGTVELP
ncbi:hypothetical protein [Pseudoxanthomonas wuyuanensis]|nr:hypothetical protein [Pseudoxanthomonas wuyuanensis]KAF1723032.1 hypothetical protein CSC75_00645 [Pseudoxanthomonas wuyuanensis]